MVVYNRLPHYLLAILLARTLGVRCFLDLEDGYLPSSGSFLIRIKNRSNAWLFDRLCREGALLAQSGLCRQTSIKKTHLCYGTAEEKSLTQKNWHALRYNILFSGTLFDGTGAYLFIEALRILNTRYPEKARRLHFMVSGKGLSIDTIAQFASNEMPHLVSFYGLLDFSKYSELLAASHVGLSLRILSHGMNNTTFPSKIIEYVENGLLVITTRNDDVENILGEDGAIFIDSDSPDAMVRSLVWLVDHVHEAQAMAETGRIRVLAACDPDKVGKGLISFLDGT